MVRRLRQSQPAGVDVAIETSALLREDFLGELQSALPFTELARTRRHRWLAADLAGKVAGPHHGDRALEVLQLQRFRDRSVESCGRDTSCVLTLDRLVTRLFMLLGNFADEIPRHRPSRCHTTAMATANRHGESFAKGVENRGNTSAVTAAETAVRHGRSWRARCRRSRSRLCCLRELSAVSATSSRQYPSRARCVLGSGRRICHLPRRHPGWRARKPRREVGAGQ